MSKIEELRKEVDSIDDELSALYLRRVETVAKIGKEKALTGTPINAAAREKEIINRVTKNASDDGKVQLKKLYEDIFFLSKTYQAQFAPLKSETSEAIREILKSGQDKFPVSASVACQGVDGAYSGIAAEKLFDISDITYFKTFDGVFNAVDKGLCDYGVLPIENSTAGSVLEVYDLMKKHKFYVVKTVRVQITHALVAVKGAKTEDIKTVYSHPQAINQCSEFLKNLGVKVIEAENTAVAAKKVAEINDKTVGAVCSEACAEINDLAILEKGIQNEKGNFTRFICISKDLKVFKGADKISVMTNLSNKPGSLYKVLSRFSVLGLNLTKLESRPIGNNPFEFTFYFDFDGDIESESVLGLIAELDNSSDKFVFLGSYKEII